ncbi:MAG: Asp-tRNA(Asn)/Glu-tRNA(Gln) amidotransferase subunit GatC [Burkholderiales bacterium]|nr:Asp-tRNA(Asn)/Glu-tRNA(Gln) amidotransferase subunit GatC [Burkholderiales bacterium]
MPISSEEVRRIARLARIAVSEPEAAEIGQKLTGIFQLIEEMQAVDTTGVEPMSHALDVMQRLREDKVTETDRHALFQAIAPQVEADLYLVPKVIE